MSLLRFMRFLFFVILAVDALCCAKIAIEEAAFPWSSGVTVKLCEWNGEVDHD